MEIKKKMYHKPQLREVKLVPEEAVLTFCRTSTGRANITNKSCTGNTKCTGRTSTEGGS